MSTFDRFADRVAKLVASAGFFAFCVLLIVLWLPSYFVVGDADTWQLIVNTATTIITFLLVALLHNTQHRFERAQNERWAALLASLHIADPVVDEGQREDGDGEVVG